MTLVPYTKGECGVKNEHENGVGDGRRDCRPGPEPGQIIARPSIRSARNLWDSRILVRE